MKIVGVILTIFLAINVAASASAIFCIDEISGLVSIEHGLDNSSSETQDSKSHSTDSSHAHCASFCAHHYTQPSFSTSILFNITEASCYDAYSFTFIQTYREGPFRPPLS